MQDVTQARQQPPLTASALQGASFDFALQTLLLLRESGWAALLPLRLPDTLAPEDIARLQAAVDQALTGAPEEAAAKTATNSMGDSAADAPCVTLAMLSIVPSMTCLSNHAMGRLTQLNITFLVINIQTSSR